MTDGAASSIQSRKDLTAESFKMQDPIEQIYYTIAIVKNIILAKGTKMCIIKTFLRPLWVLWITKSTQLSCMGKNATCMIFHSFFYTCSELTDPISKANRVI